VKAELNSKLGVRTNAFRGASITILFALSALAGGNSLEIPWEEFKAESPLDSIDVFRDQVSKKWEFNCARSDLRELDPHLNDHLRAFTENAIFEGLKKLSMLNPTWTNTLMSRAPKAKLRIYCDSNLSAPPAPMHSDDSSTLEFGSGAWLVVANHRADTKKRIEEKYGPNYLSQEKKYHAAVLLHAFLHLLEADNFSKKDHRKLKPVPEKGFQQDRIYACTAQVYPNRSTILLVSGQDAFFNTYQACKTCAQQSEDAERLCENISDSDFQVR
jgi:hypothetical protein